jgi:ribosomal protein L32
MELENYRDLSTSGSSLGAGFQFEFYCTNCQRKWKSTFKPHRMGQITSFLSRFSFLVGGASSAGRAAAGFTDYGSRAAREEALAEAIQQASSRYTICSSCKQAVCADCLDASGKTCVSCDEQASSKRAQVAEQEAEKLRDRSAKACPNCGTDNSGGRFCPECGFDMSSTHKSCPSCGAMALRQARFCTDCGHSF